MMSVSVYCLRLEMYRYEFAGLLMHAEHLEAVHGVGPHTVRCTADQACG